MSLLICFFQFLKGGVSVYLCRGNALMPQQLLHHLNFCPIVEHRRGKGVTQHVGRTLTLSSDLREATFDYLTDCPFRYARHLDSKKQCRIVDSLRLLLTHGKVSLQRLLQFCAKRNNALFVALAEHLDGGGMKID